MERPAKDGRDMLGDHAAPGVAVYDDVDRLGTAAYGPGDGGLGDSPPDQLGMYFVRRHRLSDAGYVRHILAAYANIIVF